MKKDNTDNSQLLALDLALEPAGARTGDLYLLGTVPYQAAWQWQKRLVAERKHWLERGLLQASKQGLALGDKGTVELEAYLAAPQDVLVLLQHSPVYTLGQGADSRFVRFDLDHTDHEIYRIERGGEVTYHCPGQLVGYPILDLRHYQLDLHWYLRQLEAVIIETLACYGLRGDRVPGMTGVWVEDRKVAAIGIKVSRWITMHGFALNVCPDLSGFDNIVPCGLEGKAVGAIAQFLPDISFTEVQQTLVTQFEAAFDLKLNLKMPPDEWAV
jgi:lipoyl(octanoyl) transferase